MKVLILSSDSKAASNSLLVKAGRKHGVLVECRDPRSFEWNFSSGEILCAKTLGKPAKPLLPPDWVIPRFGFWTYKTGIPLLAQFEAVGVKSLNSWSAIEKCHRKDLAYATFAKLGIPIPSTWMFHLEKEPSFLKNLGKKNSSEDFIFKTLQGSQGKGVARIEGKIGATAWTDFLRTNRGDFLFQDFVKGEDIRSLWLFGKHLGCIQRSPAKGEFRANLHLGGSAKKTKLLEEEKHFCEMILKHFQVDFAGIDWIRTPKGPVFLEINAFPGFTGLARVLATHPADSIIEQLKRR